MKRFSRLVAELDTSTRTNDKVDAIARYLAETDAANAAWAVWFLGGGRPKRLIPVRRLAEWASDESGVPPWLFEECYDAVGDLAETIALLLPEPSLHDDRPLHVVVTDSLLALRALSPDAQRQEVVRQWQSLDAQERLVFNKLLTGTFRLGVSQQLVGRALARISGVDADAIAHRLSGDWQPSPDAYARLLSGDTTDADVARPYPFFLAHPLQDEPESLGDASEWIAEWKWDGIRGQIVRRDARTWIWTRGEQLVTESYPEIVEAASWLPDGTVLDGELLVWEDGAPLPFARMQHRIHRKTVGAKARAESPVVLVAYDLLEFGGEDIRSRPLSERRARLIELLETSRAEERLLISPVAAGGDWNAVRAAFDQSREQDAEGLMLKRLDSPYGTGRRVGSWWKWKLAPWTVDAVLIYAQPGHGKRASLHSDYTFGVWNEGTLVPFAKAYSGLTDDEIRTLDRWIRTHTMEKFGPVRQVEPIHVFEIAFEGIWPSTRHKSGIAVRFPRILRWRTDKKAADADSLETLRAIMESA